MFDMLYELPLLVMKSVPKFNLKPLHRNKWGMLIKFGRLFTGICFKFMAMRTIQTKIKCCFCG